MCNFSNVSSTDLLAMLTEKPLEGGPFDEVKLKRSYDITQPVKLQLKDICNEIKIPVPQITASRIAKSDLHDMDIEVADAAWFPYAMSYMARHTVPALCGAYLDHIRRDTVGGSLHGIYHTALVKVRGVRLQVNSKTHRVKDILEMAHRLESLREEPVALSFNNKIFDWDWDNK